MRPRALLAAAGLALAAGCTCRSSPGWRYIVPERFHGCIAIALGVPGAKPFPRQDGLRVVEVTRAGEVFETSDALPWDGSIANEIWVRAAGGPRKTEDWPSGGWSVTQNGGPLHAVVCFGGGEQDVDPGFPFDR